MTAKQRRSAMQKFWGAAAVLAALAAPPAASQKTPPAKLTAFDGTAPVLLLREVGQGTALYARKADTAFVPASLVKVMTAYVVLERVRSGQMALDQKITVPAKLVARWQKWPRASSLRLRAGQSVTVGDLLQGMITLSGNDAAELLALASDGDNPEFVARMNRQAQRIGMASSRFGNPTGWPDGGKTKVTANDLARLAERLLRDHPDAYRRYFGTRQLKLGDGTIGINRNPLLGRVTGADGLKTGHTSEAGYTLIGSARRGGRRLIVVLAGATSQSQRGREGAALLDAGFDAMTGTGAAQDQKNRP